MNLKSFFTAVLLIIIPILTSAQEKYLDSKIYKATVFYNGAQIERITPTFLIQTEQTVLILKGLEQSLQESSLRVGISGPARILNVVKSMDFLEQQVSSVKIDELKEKLDLLDQDIEDQQIKIKVYELERNLLLSNIKLGGENTGVAVSQIREGAEYYRTRLMEIESKLLELERSIKKKEEEKQKIRAQLSELNYKKNRPTSRIEVTVEAESPGNCGLTLDYMVPEAGWMPSYDIRIDAVGDPVQMVRKATVHQSTGEDWEKVDLAFSTGNPMEQQVMPVLNPWYLDFSYQQVQAVVGGLNLVKAKATPQQMDKGAVQYEMKMENTLDALELEESIAPFVSTSRNSIQEFNLQTKADINADGKEYTFSLGVEELEASYHYQAIPKMEKTAYLVATMTDWEGYELIDGVANIYYEKMFIGETYLNTAMTSDSLQLSMGKDKGLIIERKSVKDLTRTRTIGTNTRKSFGYELLVRNTKPTEVELIIEDQIPLTKNSQITIEEEELSGGKLNEETGKVTWRLKMKPGDTVTIPFKYSVKYPKDKHVSF